MLTAPQIKLVKESWRIFSRIDPVLAGDVFYGRLFLIAPCTRKMFRESKTEQYKKLVAMLSFIVSRLDRSSEMMNEIRALAERHQTYGVKNHHYQLVCNTMLWTLEKGLGHDWNREMEVAWRRCYELMTAAMVLSD